MVRLSVSRWRERYGWFECWFDLAAARLAGWFPLAYTGGLWEGLYCIPASPSLPSLETPGGVCVCVCGTHASIGGSLSILEQGAWAERSRRQREGYTFTHAFPSMRIFVLRSRRCTEGGEGCVCVWVWVSPPILSLSHRRRCEGLVESRLVSSDAWFNAPAP